MSRGGVGAGCGAWRSRRRLRPPARQVFQILGCDADFAQDSLCYEDEEFIPAVDASVERRRPGFEGLGECAQGQCLDSDVVDELQGGVDDPADSACGRPPDGQGLVPGSPTRRGCPARAGSPKPRSSPNRWAIHEVAQSPGSSLVACWPCPLSVLVAVSSPGEKAHRWGGGFYPVLPAVGQGAGRADVLGGRCNGHRGARRMSLSCSTGCDADDLGCLPIGSHPCSHVGTTDHETGLLAGQPPTRRSLPQRQACRTVDVIQQSHGDHRVLRGGHGRPALRDRRHESA